MEKSSEETLVPRKSSAYRADKSSDEKTLRAATSSGNHWRDRLGDKYKMSSLPTLETNENKTKYEDQVGDSIDENDCVRPYVDLEELSRILDLDENKPIIRGLMKQLEDFARMHPQ